MKSIIQEGIALLLNLQHTRIPRIPTEGIFDLSQPQIDLTTD